MNLEALPMSTSTVDRFKRPPHPRVSSAHIWTKYCRAGEQEDDDDFEKMADDSQPPPDAAANRRDRADEPAPLPSGDDVIETRGLESATHDNNAAPATSFTLASSGRREQNRLVADDIGDGLTQGVQWPPVTPGRSRGTVPEDVAAIDERYQARIIQLEAAKEALKQSEAQLAKENGDLKTRERQKEQRIEDVEAEQQRAATEIVQKDVVIATLRERLEDATAKIRDGEDGVNNLIEEVDTLRANQQDLEKQKDELGVELQAEQERRVDHEKQLSGLEEVREAHAQLDIEWENMANWVAELTGTKAAALTFDDMKEVLRDMRSQPSHSRNSSHSSHHRHSYGEISVARTRHPSLQHEMAAVEDDSASKQSVEIDLHDIPEGDGQGEAEETLTGGVFAKAAEEPKPDAHDSDSPEVSNTIAGVKLELKNTNEQLAASQSEKYQLGNENRTLRKLLDDANAALTETKSTADEAQPATKAFSTVGVQTERVSIQLHSEPIDTDRLTPQAPQTPSDKSIKLPDDTTASPTARSMTARRPTTVQEPLPWWLLISLVLLIVEVYLAARSDFNIRFVPYGPVMWLTGQRTSRPGIGFGGPVWMDPFIMSFEAWLGVERTLPG